jgi:hypothetical protein
MKLNIIANGNHNNGYLIARTRMYKFKLMILYDNEEAYVISFKTKSKHEANKNYLYKELKDLLLQKDFILKTNINDSFITRNSTKTELYKNRLLKRSSLC